MIDLGPVQPLHELVQTWRRDFGESPAAAVAGKTLRERIWQPLEEHLASITTVYVSPDGLVGQFPLTALPGGTPGTYLLEEMAIVMLPLPQGLPAMASGKSQPSPSTIDRFCLVGGVDYNQSTSPQQAEPTTPENQTANPASPMLAVRGSEHESYISLPGTITEIETIESLIREYRPTAETTVFRGSRVSKTAFASLAPGQRYLHVATHGFFAPESVQNALTASSPETARMLGGGDGRSPRIVGSHADVLSGLVFAGANQASSVEAEGDGILTAAEVQSLDLRGVDLAVLSACAPGPGQTAGGEGVNVQQEFQLAGARTSLTSLWQVDDATTQALMVEFYRNLFERKLSKSESLRQAQIWLLNNPDAIEERDLSTCGAPRKVKPLASDAPAATPTRSLPAYWAAFQLSGDPD